MRYFLKIFLPICLVFSVSMIEAKPMHRMDMKDRQMTSPMVDRAEAKKPQKMLSLYAEPSDRSKVVDRLNLWKPFVPIYRQKDWVKVGNPANGQVGWINLKQYHQLMTEMTRRPMIRSIEIKVSDQPGDKDQMKVVAYKNGQQLSEEEAIHLLRQMNRQQMFMDRYFNRMHHRMMMQKQMMDQFFDMEDDLWNLENEDFYMMMPGMYLYHKWPFMSPMVVTTPQSEKK